MEQSTERTLTTHVGSLAREQAVTDGIFGIEQGADVDLETHAARVAAAAGAARVASERLW